MTIFLTVKSRSSIKFFVAFVFVLCVNFSLNAQQRINGYVANKKGRPIPGVNIIVSNTLTATVTNYRGFFELVIEGNLNTITINFFYIGYQSEKLVIGIENDCDYKVKVVLLKNRQKRNSIKNFITVDKFTRS